MRPLPDPGDLSPLTTRRLAIALLAVLALLAGCSEGPVPPDSIATDAPDSVLAATYAPILRMSPGERFLPSSIESMTEFATLRTLGGDSLAGPPVSIEVLLTLGTGATALDLPGTPGALDDAAEAAALFLAYRARESWRPRYYAAVARRVIYDPAGPRGAYRGSYDVIFYFFFYPYNDWRSGTDSGYNDHEGDWEGVTVYLLRSGNRAFPVYVRYSRHGGSTGARWSADVPDSLGLLPFTIERDSETHVRVYVARGSHANYPFGGDFQTGLFTDRASGTGERIEPEGSGTGGALPAAAISLFDLADPASLFAFRGLWGAPGPPGSAGPRSPVGTALTISPLDALLDSASNPYAPATTPSLRSTGKR